MGWWLRFDGQQHHVRVHSGGPRYRCLCHRSRVTQGLHGQALEELVLSVGAYHVLGESCALSNHDKRMVNFLLGLGCLRRTHLRLDPEIKFPGISRSGGLPHTH